MFQIIHNFQLLKRVEEFQQRNGEESGKELGLGLAHHIIIRYDGDQITD